MSEWLLGGWGDDGVGAHRDVLAEQMLAEEGADAGVDFVAADAVAALLGHLLDAKGVSQSQLASETGISASTISDVLAGRRALSLANIRQLADYFAVDSAVFVNSLVPSSRRRKIAS